MGDVHSSSYRRVPVPLPRLRGPGPAGGGRRRGRGAGPAGRRARSATRASRPTGARPWPTRTSTRSPSPRRTSCTATWPWPQPQAGKHLRAEKPLGRSRPRRSRSAEAVERAGVDHDRRAQLPPRARRAARGPADRGRRDRRAEPLPHADGRELRGQPAGRAVLALPARPGRARDPRRPRLARSRPGPDAARADRPGVGHVGHPGAAPAGPAPGGTHFSVVDEGAELRDVENEDWVAALVEFDPGCAGPSS